MDIVVAFGVAFACVFAKAIQDQRECEILVGGCPEELRNFMAKAITACAFCSEASLSCAFDSGSCATAKGNEYLAYVDRGCGDGNCRRSFRQHGRADAV